MQGLANARERGVTGGRRPLDAEKRERVQSTLFATPTAAEGAFLVRSYAWRTSSRTLSSPLLPELAFYDSPIFLKHFRAALR
jgi:hypothetical protein